MSTNKILPPVSLFQSVPSQVDKGASVPVASVSQLGVVKLLSDPDPSLDPVVPIVYDPSHSLHGVIKANGLAASGGRLLLSSKNPPSTVNTGVIIEGTRLTIDLTSGGPDAAITINNRHMVKNNLVLLSVSSGEIDEGVLVNSVNPDAPIKLWLGDGSGNNKWDFSTTYSVGDKVLENSIVYLSLQNNNTDNVPSLSPLYWREYINDYLYIFNAKSVLSNSGATIIKSTGTLPEHTVFLDSYNPIIVTQPEDRKSPVFKNKDGSSEIFWPTGVSLALSSVFSPVPTANNYGYPSASTTNYRYFKCTGLLTYINFVLLPESTSGSAEYINEFYVRNDYISNFAGVNKKIPDWGSNTTYKLNVSESPAPLSKKFFNQAFPAVSSDFRLPVPSYILVPFDTQPVVSGDTVVPLRVVQETTISPVDASTQIVTQVNTNNTIIYPPDLSSKRIIPNVTFGRNYGGPASPYFGSNVSIRVDATYSHDLNEATLRENYTLSNNSPPTPLSNFYVFKIKNKGLYHIKFCNTVFFDSFEEASDTTATNDFTVSTSENKPVFYVGVSPPSDPTVYDVDTSNKTCKLAWSNFGIYPKLRFIYDQANSSVGGGSSSPGQQNFILKPSFYRPDDNPFIFVSTGSPTPVTASTFSKLELLDLSPFKNVRTNPSLGRAFDIEYNFKGASADPKSSTANLNIDYIQEVQEDNSYVFFSILPPIQPNIITSFHFQVAPSSQFSITRVA